MTWAESRANCKRLPGGADLVAIETQQENEFLLKMITDLRQGNCAIVLTSGRKNSEGGWYWASTGKPFSYTYWWPGEPNNVEGAEDVVEFYYHTTGTYRWNDRRAGQKFCSLCEIP
ncbi:hypothetical protein NP493_482g02000 [Ridgeia piscesae]|uniref:C-type lectin domain-containing protein n=1 Tax=Ridgeia piscesae TaxID=27915 RepID=A0AAD9KZ58_RIDPI|nr:hypothetical protein NP493_482g02000 [Ridgeia piscesae]